MTMQASAGDRGALRLWERLLGAGALIAVTLHMWLSIYRYILSPQNNMFVSEPLKVLLNVEKWYVLVWIVAAVAFLIVAHRRCPEVWARFTESIKRLASPEWLILAGLFGWYLVSTASFNAERGNVYKSYDWWLLDMALCVFVLFPLGTMMDRKRVRRWIDIMLHAFMAFTTAVITWMLWHLFRREVIILPSGLAVEMLGNSFTPGVYYNIGASIGLTVIMIAMYMIASKPVPVKIVYGVALIPNLVGTLLTNCRSVFLALMVCVPMMAFFAVWNRLSDKPLQKRALICGAAAIVALCLLWVVREGVFRMYAATTSADATVEEARSLQGFSGRDKIWAACFKMMFDSPKRFFIGMPFGDAPSAIESFMTQIYGTGMMVAHAHNIILQVGICLGVPAMLAFLFFLVKMSIRCVRVGLGKGQGQFQGAYALPIGLLGMMIVNMAEAYLFFYFSFMACVFFLYCGWILTVDEKQRIDG